MLANPCLSAADIYSAASTDVDIYEDGKTFQMVTGKLLKIKISSFKNKKNNPEKTAEAPSSEFGFAFPIPYTGI